MLSSVEFLPQNMVTVKLVKVNPKYSDQNPLTDTLVYLQIALGHLLLQTYFLFVVSLLGTNYARKNV